MYPYNKSKALHSFKPVRVLSGKDLYLRYGSRVPVDTTDFLGFSRNPLERFDKALDNARMSAEDYARIMADLESQKSTSDSPPAESHPASEE